ncbi:hypothetical protein [Ruegeria arenilitoris]|uniref:hypothetical protein n=1 Tax=Ruegeria arenilitoris TaxID=1173585 RepID=UPI00147B4AC5|nr:hypothetical protein [Ruegeria arenilitoris]
MEPISQPSRGPQRNKASRMAKQQTVSSCGFDEFEEHVLHVSRYFFLAFSEPQSEAWIDAFRHAEQVFPVPFGATIANAVLIALNDMRQSRIRAFSYTNPHCVNCAQGITDEERYLILALQSIRRGIRGVAETNCMLLCEGGHNTKLLASLERIAIITGDVSKPRYN